MLAPRMQLIFPGGRLCPGLPLRRCGLRCGDVLTALLQVVPTVVTTEKTFAALADGAVVTWGEELRGAESLSAVVELTASDAALAALKADGSVVCWGMEMPSLTQERE